MGGGYNALEDIDNFQRLKPNKPYDDPYAILASQLVAILPVKSLKKALTNNQYIRGMVINEALNIDVYGYFLDCIDECIIKNEHLRAKNKQLRALGDYYFSELDLPRLREEIKKFAGEMGISLDD